jgi:peptide/nickel transport system substrate-binding protein
MPAPTNPRTLTSQAAKALRPLAGAVTLSSLLLLSACGGSAGPGDDAGEPQSGGDLKLAFRSDNTKLVSLDPFQVYWIEHRSVIRSLADSLTDQDPETGEVVPWLAESWEINDDATEFVFNLRDDVTFSNGEEFNAEAVKTAFDANAELAEELPTTFGRAYIEGYTSTEAVDEHTVKVTFDVPNAAFLQATATTNLAILAPESYEKDVEERNLGDYIGSGPFTLEEYSPESHITVTRREGYAWPSDQVENQGEAHLDSITYSYIPEDANRVGSVLSGEIDLAWPRDPFTEEDYQQILGEGLEVSSKSVPGITESLYPNVKDGRPFSDENVRLAFNKSLDREEYAHTIFGEDFPVAEGVLEPSTPHYLDLSEELAYDPEGAADLLEEAGWELDDDGFRYKDGDRLTLVYPITDEKPGDVLLQDQLARVGFDLELEPTTEANIETLHSDGDYDLYRGVLTRGDPAVIQSAFDLRYDNAPRRQNNYTDEDQKKLQELLDKGLETPEDTERQAIYEEAQRLQFDGGYVFPVFARTQQVAVRPEVHGLSLSAEALFISNDVWLDED